jgi:hypothetical protein
MNTELENRLSAALRARTDLVTPESLPPLEVPEARVVPFVRRPAPWLIAAAACAALIALPFILNGGSDRAELPPASPGPTETTTPAALTGDLDGDGTDETVTIDQHGVISVVLASSDSGTPVTADAGADGSTLAGLVRIDDSGADAVVADDGGTGRVFRVTADGLVQVDVVGGQDFNPFTHNEDGATWAVLGNALITASATADKAVFDARTWRLNPRGLLDSTYIGRVCSGATAGIIAYCGGGSGVVVGDLQVALFPEATDVIHSGQSFPIAIDGGGGPGTVSLDGSTHSVDFPGGSPAEQVTIPGTGNTTVYTTLMPGTEVPGIVVRQTRTGGFDFFLIVTWRGGHLTLLDTGDQTYSGDDQFTWLSSTGGLFTLWPNPSADGDHVKMWSMDSQTGLTTQDVTNPDGSRLICFDMTADPVTYAAC